MTRYLRSFLVLSVLSGAAVVPFVATDAMAADPEEGILVKVIVTDMEGKPIPTAVVRHPMEADRHRVNTFDGSWEAAVLYLPDGSELKFLKGDTLEFEVSAPGYVNQRIMYVVRARKNIVPVVLEKMQLNLEEEEEEDPVIQFGRDKPIDGKSGKP